MAEEIIHKLSELHMHILDLVFLNKNNEQIAQELEVSRNTVSRTKNSPIGQAYLLEKRQKSDAALFSATQRICGIVDQAIDCLEDNLLSVKSRLREGKKLSPTDMQCITTILKYSGLEPEQGARARGLEGLLSPDDIERLKSVVRVELTTPKEIPSKGEEDERIVEGEIEQEEAK